MFRSSCGVYAAAIIGVLILWGGSAIAGEVFLQPRLETGAMEYTFKSQAINQIEVSQPVPEQSGFSITQTAFDFSGFMPFVSAGGTSMLLTAAAVGVLINIAKTYLINTKSPSVCIKKTKARRSCH